MLIRRQNSYAPRGKRGPVAVKRRALEPVNNIKIFPVYTYDTSGTSVESV
jgi:hypothetical protein